MQLPFHRTRQLDMSTKLPNFFPKFLRMLELLEKDFLAHVIPIETLSHPRDISPN